MVDKASVPGVDIDVELAKMGHKSTRKDALARLSEAGAVDSIAPLLGLCRKMGRKWRKITVEAIAGMGGAAVRPLVDHGLAHKSATVRYCAVRALSLLGPAARDAYPALLERLDDDDVDVRLRAIEALGELGEPRAAGPLAALLEADDEDVREDAVEALGELGEAALDAVGEVFERSDLLHVRGLAVEAWREIGESAIPRLRAVVAERAHPADLRIAALSALQDLLGDDVVPLLQQALGDDDKLLRRYVARALAHVDTRAATALLTSLCEDADKKVRSLAVRALRDRYATLLADLAEGETAALPALLIAWRAMGDKHADASEEIVRALGEMGAVSAPALAGALSSALAAGSPAADIIDVLAQAGPEMAVAYDTLVETLDHPDLETCCAAAHALGVLGEERAVPVLAERLYVARGIDKAGKQQRKRLSALQRAAAESLGALGKAALPAALDAAHSKPAADRVGGLIALGYIGGGRALATLERAVRDGDSAVRQAAAEALERAAADDVIRLGRMLDSEDAQVRVKAVHALGRLGDLRSLDLLLRAYGDPSEQVNAAAVDALARREGGRANSVLIAAAAGGNVTALRALREQPVREAIPALMEALDAPWYEIYSEALETIRVYLEAFSQDPEAVQALRSAVPELIYLLHDESAKTRRLALEALGSFDGVDAARDVADLLLDQKRDIQLAAARMLAAMGGAEVARLYAEQVARLKDEELAEQMEEIWEETTDREL